MKIIHNAIVLTLTIVILYLTGGLSTQHVKAADSTPYFYTETAAEMKLIASSSTNVQYGTSYALAPKKNLNYIYKITVTKKGYLTFTGNNPYRNIYNGTLQTTMGLLEPAGNCLWFHKYDYYYEPTTAHSYKIGLDTGVYFFFIKNNSFDLRNTSSNMTYSFNFTENDNYEVEPNNTRAMAKEYIYGNTISGEYGCRTPGTTAAGIADDYYRLMFVKGRSYEITFSMTTQGLYRSAFYLENSSGNVLANSNNLKNGKYTYTCSKSGTYYLHVGNTTINAISIIQPYTFNIVENFTSPATTIKKVKRSKKSVTVYWKKKSGITGYELQYSTSKAKIGKGKNLIINGYGNTKRKITKLKAKKAYYVRVRTFTISYNKTVYSSWSSIKKIKKYKKKK